MSAITTKIPDRKYRPAISVFVADAAQYQCIEVEAIYITRLLDGKTCCEVCPPDAPPAMFSVYLRRKTEDGGLARCIADFSHPHDAVEWAQETGRKAGLSVDVRFDLSAIEKLRVEIGENVIAPLAGNALCGSIATIDSSGRATLSGCYDLYGKARDRTVWVSECRRLWEKPRRLTIDDVAWFSGYDRL